MTTLQLSLQMGRLLSLWATAPTLGSDIAYACQPCALPLLWGIFSWRLSDHQQLTPPGLPRNEMQELEKYILSPAQPCCGAQSK